MRPAIPTIASPAPIPGRSAALPDSAGRLGRWSGRRLAVVAALVAGDAVTTGLAVAAALLVAAAPEWTMASAALAVFAVLVPLHAYLGLYDCWGPCPIERLRLRAQGAATLTILAGLVLSAWTAPATLAAALLLGIALFVIGHYVEALARHGLMRAGIWGAPTVLLGSPEIGLRIARRLLREPKLGLRPVGLASNRPYDEGEGAPVPILCGVAEARQLAGLAEVAIVAAADLAPAEGRAAISLSDLRFAHVIVAEDAGGLPNLGLRTRNLGSSLGFEVRFDLFQSGHLAAKRLIDLSVAVPLLLAAAPLILVLALLVKAVDPGRAFYAQRRVGRDGRVIEVLKLRTMYSDAEQRLHAHLAADSEARAEWERYFKLRDDPRILPVIGRFLRRSSLDELPQLLNILYGEMSLVGPRPFPAYHMQSFDPVFQSLRVSVPPGLTGLWQVGSRSGGDIEVQKDEDLFYIRNWSLWLDIYILFETLPAVLSARGAR